MMRRRAFTLLEVVVALALFGGIAIVIGQASFISLESVRRLSKDSMSDAYKNFMREKILSLTNLEELRTGTYIEDPFGEKIRVTGDAEPTGIMDLFILRVVSENKKYSDVFYLQRSAWYDQMVTTVDREDMLKDRKDFLEDYRRQNFKAEADSK